jgi:hypothetical protein
MFSTPEMHHILCVRVRIWFWVGWAVVTESNTARAGTWRGAARGIKARTATKATARTTASMATTGTSQQGCADAARALQIWSDSSASNSKVHGLHSK